MMQTTVDTLRGQDVMPRNVTEVAPEVNTVAYGPALGPKVARYDAQGVAITGGVADPPQNAGEALNGALANMVGDIRNRQSQYADVPMPGMPSNTETQTVIIRDSGNANGGKVLLLGTLICVAAAAVTLYQAHHGRHK